MHPREIWSGGQTGVDRAAWDAARKLGLTLGGWVPRGRLAEDGPIPDGYPGLHETLSAEYSERTTGNVRDTDATLILHRGALRGGTAFTHAEAVRLGRPVLAVDLDGQSTSEQVSAVRNWLAQIPGARLNVAGPRASTDPELHGIARKLLLEVLSEPRP
jgi:hypothetical protein